MQLSREGKEDDSDMIQSKRRHRAKANDGEDSTREALKTESWHDVFTCVNEFALCQSERTLAE